jgi:hypothetical protein
MNNLSSEVLIVVGGGSAIVFVSFCLWAGFVFWKMHRDNDRYVASLRRDNEAMIQWLMAMVMSLMSKIQLQSVRITELEQDLEEMTAFANKMESRAVFNAGYKGELRACREFADQMTTYFLRELEKLAAALDKVKSENEKRRLLEIFLTLVIAAFGGGHAAA